MAAPLSLSTFAATPAFAALAEAARTRRATDGANRSFRCGPARIASEHAAELHDIFASAHRLARFPRI